MSVHLDMEELLINSLVRQRKYSLTWMGLASKGD